MSLKKSHRAGLQGQWFTLEGESTLNSSATLMWSSKKTASSDDRHKEEQDDNEEDLLKSAHLELIRSTCLYPAAFMQ